MRDSIWHIVALLLSGLLGSSCSTLADFDTDGLEESNAALCSDEVDNDGDNLVDCQDFGCLSQEVCCTIPTIVVADTFEGDECASADCDAPAPGCSALDKLRWRSWGTPLPIVCEGGLAPHKEEQCYDVGVLSRDAFVLQPGLSVVVGIVGRPERRGRLEAGLTFQAEVQTSYDPCDPVNVVTPVISIQQLSDSEGYRFVATFDRRQVAVSDRITDTARHEISFTIEEDRRVHYAVDGIGFAVSPGEHPVPDNAPEVHLSLAGRGLTARFEDVVVTAGTRCDAPRAWTAMEPFISIPESRANDQWDGFFVRAPRAVRAPSGALRVFYTGCPEVFGQCDHVSGAVGVARGEINTELVRENECALMGNSAVLCDGGLANPFENDFYSSIDLSPLMLDGEFHAYASQLEGGVEIKALRFEDGLPIMVDDRPDRIRLGTVGTWDSYEVCCATAIVEEGQVKLWYAGRDGPNAPMQVGLATSADGLRFAKHPNNPVVRVGQAGNFDERGVTSPTVVYSPDRGVYRMWYEAQGFLRVTSIGYAVSTDGILWIKYPQNPVLAAEDVGLKSLGHPSIVSEQGRFVLWIHGETRDSRGGRIYGLLNAGLAFGDDGSSEE